MAALADDIKDHAPPRDAVDGIGAAGPGARLPAIGLVEKVADKALLVHSDQIGGKVCGTRHAFKDAHR